MFTNGFDFSSAMRILAVSFIPAALGIILHEVAHGWMARRCGDPTAENAGRLTLNPISHVDPMGLAMFVLTSISGSYVFGWAKPVPVNPNYFHNAKRDMMLVSLAGPMTNFLLAVFFGILLYFSIYWLPYNEWKGYVSYRFLLSSCQAGVIINFGLGWLNLVPVPPLDGSKILAYFLPPHLAWKYMDMGRYGFIILLLLLFTGILTTILRPLVNYSVELTFSLLNLI